MMFAILVSFQSILLIWLVWAFKVYAIYICAQFEFHWNSISFLFLFFGQAISYYSGQAFQNWDSIPLPIIMVMDNSMQQMGKCSNAYFRQGSKE
jgi:hypothetical protein